MHILNLDTFNSFINIINVIVVSQVALHILSLKMLNVRNKLVKEQLFLVWVHVLNSKLLFRATCGHAHQD